MVINTNSIFQLKNYNCKINYNFNIFENDKDLLHFRKIFINYNVLSKIIIQTSNKYSWHMAINSVLLGLLGILWFCKRVRLESKLVSSNTVHGEHYIPGTPLNK